jgi:hypothetical protein
VFLRAIRVATTSAYGPSRPCALRAGSGSASGAKRSSTPFGTTATRSPGTPSTAVSSPRENSETVITSRARRATRGSSQRCQRTYAAPYHSGWRSAAASWMTTTLRRLATGARFAGE